MPTPRELSQQIPTPRAKTRMQKPHGGGKVLMQILGVRGGGMVMDEIDTCINQIIYGSRSIRFEGAMLWNHLPDHIKSAGNLNILKKHWTGPSGECS